MAKKALITGITGQDGSYLAEFLLEKDYEVHGIVRRASISNTARIDHLIEKKAIHLHDGDLSDSSGLIRLVGEIKPDEIYNLAAQSHVQVSFDAPEYSGDVDALGVLRVLEAVRVCGLTKSCKVYQASTSELYGNGGGGSAARNYAVPSVQPLRGGEAVRLLDGEGVPRRVWHVRGQRYSVQSRIRAPR